PASTAARVRPSPSGHNPAYVSNVTIADVCPRRSCTVLTLSPYWISIDSALVSRDMVGRSCARRGKLGNHRARHVSNRPGGTTKSGRGQGDPVLVPGPPHSRSHLRRSSPRRSIRSSTGGCAENNLPSPRGNG